MSRPGSAWLKTQQRIAWCWARLVDDRTWVHFLHVGKTGGMAIKAAVRQGGDEPRHELIGNSAESVCSPGHRILLHEHGTSLKDVPKGDKFFFFLRDPVSRFVSGFFERRRKGLPQSYYSWGKVEHMAFQRYQTPNQLALALSAESENEREFAAHAMHNIGHVKDFYSRWYESKEYFLSRISDALMVGRVEKIDSHFSKLKSNLNLSPKSDLPTSEEGANKNPYPSSKTNLDEEARRNLRKWYRKDYGFLELCEKYAHRLNYPA